MAQVLGEHNGLSPRRSAFEIRTSILRVAADGSVKQTDMMYRSNTPWIALHKNLESLLAAGFMLQTGVGPGAEYEITEKGRRVLQDYVSLIEKTTAPPEVA